MSGFCGMYHAYVSSSGWYGHPCDRAATARCPAPQGRTKQKRWAGGRYDQGTWPLSRPAVQLFGSKHLPKCFSPPWPHTPCKANWPTHLPIQHPYSSPEWGRLAIGQSSPMFNRMIRLFVCFSHCTKAPSQALCGYITEVINRMPTGSQILYRQKC